IYMFESHVWTLAGVGWWGGSLELFFYFLILGKGFDEHINFAIYLAKISAKAGICIEHKLLGSTYIGLLNLVRLSLSHFYGFGIVLTRKIKIILDYLRRFDDDDVEEKPFLSIRNFIYVVINIILARRSACIGHDVPGRAFVPSLAHTGPRDLSNKAYYAHYK
ncbi:hypothetical protein ACJX0J_007310, partial [Zea mays]